MPSHRALYRHCGEPLGLKDRHDRRRRRPAYGEPVGACQVANGLLDLAFPYRSVCKHENVMLMHQLSYVRLRRRNRILYT